MGGNPIYILFIFSDIRDNLTLPDSISFETSFKHCNLKLIPSSSPLPPPIKEIVFEGILSVAGSQSQEHIARLLGALSKVYPEDDTLPRIPARLVSLSDRIYLHMDGCYTGFYIVGRNCEASRITAIRYTSAKSVGTILEIDSKPLGRDLWLLGKGSFEALRLEQVVRMTLLQTARPVILVISPMPAMPTSAGNRRRLVATCEFLKSAGFDIDFAYVAHEDQIYRRFNQTPPTDLLTMVGYFRHLYLIELAEPVRLKTGANGFDIDDWCPPEVDSFVLSYFAASPGTKAILVNYVWLSRALEAAPNTVLKLIDTHDRFAGRKAQYQPFRAEANFFHTNEVGEARGLLRADIAIAIQAHEQTYFTEIMGRQAALLLPNVREMRTFKPPEKLESIGFLGHGNDANLHSIGRFAAYGLSVAARFAESSNCWRNLSISTSPHGGWG